MSETKRIFKQEELEAFLETHLAQKQENPTELAETLRSLNNPVEVYFAGVYEGLINGIVMAGCGIEGIYDPEKEVTD